MLSMNLFLLLLALMIVVIIRIDAFPVTTADSNGDQAMIILHDTNEKDEEGTQAPLDTCLAIPNSSDSTIEFGQTLHCLTFKDDQCQSPLDPIAIFVPPGSYAPNIITHFSDDLRGIKCK